MAVPVVQVGVEVAEPAEQQAPSVEVSYRRRVGVPEEDPVNQLHGVIESVVDADGADEW